MTLPAINVHDANSLSGLKRQAAERPEAALEAAAKQFESLFVHMMLKAMRETVSEDGLMGGASVRQSEEMLDAQLASHLTRGDGIGLAKPLLAQLRGPTVAPGLSSEGAAVQQQLNRQRPPGA